MMQPFFLHLLPFPGIQNLKLNNLSFSFLTLGLYTKIERLMSFPYPNIFQLIMFDHFQGKCQVYDISKPLDD